MLLMSGDFTANLNLLSSARFEEGCALAEVKFFSKPASFCKAASIELNISKHEIAS